MGAATSKQILKKMNCETARLIVLQFTYSNPHVSFGIPERAEEIDEDFPRRPKSPTGEQIMTPTDKVGLSDLPRHLAPEFELVDAFSQRRLNGNYISRFVFCRRPKALPSDEFKRMRPKFIGVLKKICMRAIWKAMVHRNPLIIEGEEILGEYSVNISMAARKPLYDKSGKRVAIWPKDHKGKKVGEHPIPLGPEFEIIFFRGNELRLVKSY